MLHARAAKPSQGMCLESGTVRQDCAPAGLDFVFHMFFLVKYSKSLEEGSFRGRSADFLWMLLFGGLRQTPLNDICMTHAWHDLDVRRCESTRLSISMMR